MKLNAVRLMSRTTGKLVVLGASCAMLSALSGTEAHAQVALSPQTVQVPASMKSAPFDTTRTLNIPTNFNIAVYARVGGARFLALTPDGNLLVSQPGSGKISLVRPNPNGDPTVSDFVSGLNKPHDMVFHTVGATTWLYVSESSQIDRFPFNNGDITAHDKQTIISGLPDDSSGELQGRYAHALKNIALDGNDKLYVEVSSATNADPADVTANPPRATLYQYNADGTGGRLFATGLRNAEGLAIVPNTVDNLWVCVNNRDNIAYPFHNDWDGDGTDDYGKVMQSYVDNHPPEEFTHVRDGGNYGWPYANPNPDTSTGFDNMPFDLDVQNNADGSHGAASSFDRINKGIQAHSAPLGLTFLGDTAFPAALRNGVTIALHGSWNRAQKTGYKVVYFPWDTTNQMPGAQSDFVSGWADASSNWGRPVDTAVDAQGSMFISDDGSGTIYKLSQNAAIPTPTPVAQAVTSLTLINADTDQPINGFAQMASGATIDFAQIGTRNLSIRANTNPANVGSVVFALDGNANYHTENAAPYAIAGDNTSNGVSDYLPWTPTVGSHMLTATPFSGSNGSGSKGTPLSVSFTVVDGSASVGSGLSGAYFNSENFVNPVLNRTDATVNFDWGSGSPASAVRADSFSARWTGQVKATTTGKYVFSTVSDDGVRLWVNGVQVINNWTLHGPTTNNSTSISLTAGQKLSIKMEFYEHTGGAVAKLLWKTPGGTSQTIPTAQLFPTP